MAVRYFINATCHFLTNKYHVKIIEKYIGKDLRDISMEDLRTYFQVAKVESDTIEYKSYYVKNQNNHHHKESAIVKSVCALLNSEGGMIIWGAPIEVVNENTQVKEYYGELSLVDQLIDKDSFISKICQSIIPMPIGVKIEILKENGNCACVIEVQKSETRPHRYDGRYWMRLDGQTQVGPHHYVEALMKQVKYPNIECFIKLEEFKTQEWTLFDLELTKGKMYHWLAIRHFIINWSGHMNEEQVMFQIVIEKGKFVQSLYSHNSSNYRYDGKVYRPNSRHEILYYGEPLTENYYIIIDPDELLADDEFRIIMTVGGRFSPQKWSTYSIKVPELLKGNLNEALVIEDENSLVIDKHNQIGKTKDKILNDLLKR